MRHPNSPGDAIGDAESQSVFCLMPLSRALDPGLNPTMPDPCDGPPANAYCPAAAVTTTPSPRTLPDTAVAGAPGAPAISLGLAAGLLGALAVVAVRRRRRA
ncbi:MAG: hypothetical protein QOE92_2438 [Chloroflexota bacterium]|jgi:MYXO-CTERM domain-containing protein|nr:hypothetical protein [Chloroflexota bacterium]